MGLQVSQRNMSNCPEESMLQSGCSSEVKSVTGVGRSEQERTEELDWRVRVFDSLSLPALILKPIDLDKLAEIVEDNLGR